MGNQNTKDVEKYPLSEHELELLDAAFRVVGFHDKCPKEKLLQTWKSIIDIHLAECTVKYLYRYGNKSMKTISKMQFAEPYNIIVRGTIDEKLNFLIGALEKTDTNEVPIAELDLFIAAVIRSYINMHLQLKTAVYQSWERYGYHMSERTVMALVKDITRDCVNEKYVDLQLLQRCLQLNPLFLIIFKEIIIYLYSRTSGNLISRGSSDTTPTNILPINEGLIVDINVTPILDIPHVIFINSHLPNGLRHKWRLLFSSSVMGESFSTMLGKIMNTGPTLLIIEDEDQFMFGGFAPVSWSLTPKFVGDDSSMLITLSPEIRCFNATGYNEHYQYLNLNQQTMPNGLGMGGQFNYWGLWMDSDYGLGQSSESCTTFRDYVQLSKRKEFKIKNMEVWGIGDEPKPDIDCDDERNSTKRSVLDNNLEDRVMLELSGKTMHSAGLREPDMDL